MNDEETASITFKERVGAYQRVFSGEDGKLVFEDLMNFTGVNRSSYDVDSTNATFVNEGARSVGLRIQRYKNFKEVRNTSNQYDM